MIYETHTARKQYRCDAGFTCYKVSDPLTNTSDNMIEPGERYNAEVYPPWTLTAEDPEGPAYKLGEWITHRYHLACGPGF